MFEPGLFLSDVAPWLTNDFGLVPAASIVALPDAEAARILAHGHHPIQLLQSTNPAIHSPSWDGPKGKGAPTPTEGVRRGIMHMRKSPADVYWFRIERRDHVVGHKIGWAFQWKRRLRLFNSMSLPKIGGLHYQMHKAHSCTTVRDAFGVERCILRELDAY